MGVIGVILIVVGVILCVTGAFVIGIVVIAFGGICCSVGSNSKEKSNQRSKEDWILDKTSEYISSGMNPSDAKVKAEVDYLQGKKKTQEQDNKQWVCSKCGTLNESNYCFCKRCMQDK